MTDRGDYGESFQRWEEEWDAPDWDLSDEEPTSNAEPEIHLESLVIRDTDGDGDDDDDWDLRNEQPSYRADPAITYEELSIGGAIAEVEGHAAFKAREGSALNRSAVYLSVVLSTILGGLAVAGICNLASASSTMTLAFSLPAFVLILMTGIVLTAIWHPPST
ncbi:hypothetical protein [Streptomyces sp. TLI_185]|uniref:hypothetical protein n=1 Tax=Streptomyces sp. TLI_185 TaxID=2485151 RepID=UPI000F4E8F4A|nr:hypothetical protein [Streptomyces sp. TLI_185]RPF33422.1 hypothetical protein EDD92_3334 [Streptomyces sp. TLI_185]